MVTSYAWFDALALQTGDAGSIAAEHASSGTKMFSLPDKIA